MREVVLRKTVSEIYDIIHEENTVKKFSSRGTEKQIKKQINQLNVPIPSLDQLNIFKFTPIPDLTKFYMVVSSDVESGPIWLTTFIGAYRTKEELEPVMDKYEEDFELGDMWWVKINMEDFKIGELTKQNPREIRIKFFRTCIIKIEQIIYII